MGAGEGVGTEGSEIIIANFVKTYNNIAYNTGFAAHTNISRHGRVIVLRLSGGHSQLLSISYNPRDGCGGQEFSSRIPVYM